MTRVAGRLLPAAACVVAVVALPAAPASAETAPAVERTAWFNAAGGGLAAPQPTTEEGDLRVVRALDTQAFATLLYRGEGVRAALDVSIREGSANGEPDVVACPTVGADWSEGANQPMDDAPEVDCSSSLAYGLLSDDGRTLTFGLDGGFQVEPGTWSVALVPAPGGVAPGPPPKAALPFALDLEPPPPGAFVLEEEFVLPTLSQEEAPPAAAGQAEPASGFATGGDLGAVPLDSGSGTVDAPALDPSVAAPSPPSPAPPAPVAAAPVFVRKAAAAGDDDSGRRLLALLALAGGSAAVGYAAGQQRPGPRLIGGRARLAPAGVLAGAAAPHVDDRPRGIGRFARPRDAAPRRLR